jgi:hypothetical protein
MPKMTDDELLALTGNELRHAIGYFGGKLAEQRRKAEYYYLGLAKGDLAPPSVDGRSAVVVPVVRNTIESMLPQLMVKFTGGDTVVEFEPTQQDDEARAKQCTDYLNYLFFKKNNGHSITYSWFKDALKLKRGIVKVWWDTRDEETREEYKGLSEVEVAELMEDPEVSGIDQRTYPDEEDAKMRQDALAQLQQQLDQALNAAQQPQPPGQPGQPPQPHPAMQAVEQIQQKMQEVQSAPQKLLYDVGFKRKKTGGKLSIENVPPEEFLISRKAKDIQTSPFVGHRVQRTLSELKSMGYKNVDKLGSDEGTETNAERSERLSYDDEYGDLDEDTGDASQKRVWLIECYIRCDFDGDGIAELRKVCRAGGRILSNEIVDAVPFVSVCPIPEPHKFFGLSIADLAMPGQLAETGLLRSVFDNQWLEVNGRYFAVEGQVNLDDLLTSRPGGVVRTKAPGVVGRLDQGKGNMGESMSLMEYMKGFNEDSTGWSRLSQGNDPSSLNKNETATKTNVVVNKADMRTDLIARNFAEGFVELFKMMLKLVCQHQDKRVEVKLGGEWVGMDPREWRNQFDVSINVGLGVGSKDQQIQHLMALQQAQANGLAIGIATPDNLYASCVELAKNMGFKSGDKFFTRPDPNKPPPNPEEGMMKAEQMKAQVKAQADIQAKQIDAQAQMQIEQMRAERQTQVDVTRQQAESEQQAMKIQNEKELAILREQLADQRAAREAEYAYRTAVEVARINNAAKLDVAQITAETTLTAAQETASDTATND